MNAKKARLNRQIKRSARFVNYHRWQASEPPRFRFLKWRKWKKDGVKMGYC